jgi:hypothetical protein
LGAWAFVRHRNILSSYLRMTKDDRKDRKPNTVVLVSLKPLENDLRFKEHLRRRPSTVSVPPAVAEAEDKLDIVAGCYVRKL